MARVRLPLMSLSVSGSIAKTLTFTATKNGPVCGKKRKSTPQNSAAEIENQLTMKNARAAYFQLSAGDIILWQRLATKYSRSAWVCFFAEYRIQMIEPPDMPLIPAALL